MLRRFLPELVVISCCGGVILGQGAKVLSGSAQGLSPPRRGSWSCRAARTARWWERGWGRRWSEGRSRRDQKQRSLHAWMTLGWTETQTWATVCVHLNKEDSQGTMTLTDNKEERLRKTKDLQCMMTHALASTTLTDFPSVSGHFAHCWDFHSALRVNNSLVVAVPNLFTFWPVRKFLIQIHTAKTVLWGVVFTPPSVRVDRRQL